MIKLVDLLKELDVHPDEKQCDCTPETIVKEVCGPWCKGKKWVGKKLGLSKGTMS